jgi:hypothetical protein
MRHAVRLARAALASVSALVIVGCTTNAGEPDLTTRPPDSGASRMKTSCYAGDMHRCDDLAAIVPEDTDIWRFAATCGGRLAAPEARCVERLPQAPMPKALAFDDLPLPGLELARDCSRGTLSACDSITSLAAPPPELLEYGRTCGGRVQRRTAVTCVGELADEEPLPPAAPVEDLDKGLRERLGTLAYACVGSDLAACDALTAATPEGYEPYRDFGASCGERRQATTGSCADDATLHGLLPAGDPSEIEDETEVELRELAIACGDGDYASCARLVDHAVGPEYRAFTNFGRACGGRDAGDLPSACLAALGEEPSSAAQPPAPPRLEPDVPEPTRAQDDLLAAIEKQLNERAPGIYEFQTDGLRAGSTSRLVVLIKRPVKLQLSPRVRDLADEQGEITVGIRPTLRTSDPGVTAIGEPEGRTTLRIRVRRREAFLSAGGEIGRFATSPTNGGTPELSMLVANQEINGHEVAKPISLELGRLAVEDEPVWKRFWQPLVALALALVTLATLWRFLAATRPRVES